MNNIVLQQLALIDKELDIAASRSDWRRYDELMARRTQLESTLKEE